MSKMLYNINDAVPTQKLLPFSLQLMLSVVTASILIANICGVDVGAALVGAGLSTIVYLCATKFQSPMFISNSGAYVTPVITALASTSIPFAHGKWIGTPAYAAVFIGGIVSCLVYCLFGFIFTKIPVEKIYNIFPKPLIGAVTVVIGINLMGFIPTYVGTTGQRGISCMLVTMVAIALFAHFCKGTLKLLPFLLGTLVGYVYALLLSWLGNVNIVDFSAFKGVTLFRMPQFAFMQWGEVDWGQLASLVVMYVAYTVSAIMECLSDHAALGGIIGVDLYEKPGLGKIFRAEGLANLTGTFVGGLGQCSYGEGVATVGASRAASTKITFTAAIMLMCLGFLGPVQAFIASIPNCVFAGTAVILYGFIAVSGIKMLQKVNLDVQKNLIIVSAVLSLGICGVAVGGEVLSFSTTALALIVGVILNLVLRDKEKKASAQ